MSVTELCYCPLCVEARKREVNIIVGTEQSTMLAARVFELLDQLAQAQALNTRLVEAGRAVLKRLDRLEEDCANNCFNFPEGHVRRMGDDLRTVIAEAEGGDSGE